MNNLTRHILLPSLAPLHFFIIAATPVEVLGCRNRGLLALGIAFSSLLGALFCTLHGAKDRSGRDPRSRWWLATTLILVIAPVALIILA